MKPAPRRSSQAWASVAPIASIALMALCTLGTLAGAVPAQPAWRNGAYKDVTQHLDPQTLRIHTRPDAAPARALPGADPGPRTLVWAFATGECGSERWGDFDTDRFAAPNKAAFVAAGADYIIATGGEAGIFTCSSEAGMLRFLARYDSPRLVGLDFDIEGKQTPLQIDALVQQIKALAQRRPELRMSFTLATHASADGSQRSLNATGERVLASLRRHGLAKAVLNLMVMNYGPADARWCVLADGASPPRCDMGRSALQAARNVHVRYGWPLAQIGLTPMLGENDVAGNVFTPRDAHWLLRGARQMGLAGVHHWSLDRDRACDAGDARVSPRCHGLPGVPAGRFGEILGRPAP